MRNCAATYTESCMSGQVLLVAVALQTGKRMATASYKQSADVWQLVSAKGPANRVLTPGLERLIDQFTKRIPCVCGFNPNPSSLAEAKHDGMQIYAKSEEFVGVPITHAPQYIGTATLPAAYLPAEGPYGEIGLCDARPSASQVMTSAAHAGH